MTTTTVDLSIRAAVRVGAPIESAFDVFTLEMGSWWPLESTPIHPGRGLSQPDALRLEPWEGGRLYELVGDNRLRWGTVLSWDPPRRLVFEWETDASHAPTEVEVRFTQDAEDTLVEVVHRGWEFVAASAREAHNARAPFAGECGWGWLLDRYANAVGG